MNHVFHIPFPTVSGNHATRHGKFGSYTSPKAKLYRIQVLASIIKQKAAYHLSEPFNITVEAWPPDKRRRDKDNMIKVAMDACTLAGVWNDDSLFHDLHILAWKPVDKANPHLRITLESVPQ